MVGDDDAGSGSVEGVHDFLHHALALVHVGMLSVDHGVFSAHVVDRDWAVGRGMDRRHHIEVGQGRFDHEQVRAFCLVQLSLHHGLVDRCAWVHLVAPPVTGSWRGSCCIAEGPIEGRGVLDGVRQHPSAVMSSLFQGGADGSDAAVHHVGGTDVIGAGLRRQDGHLGEGCHRFVVDDRAVNNVTTMAVIRDRAHAHVGHQDDGFPWSSRSTLRALSMGPSLFKPKRPSESLASSG